ncbi:MAG: peptide chain release factor N(5)-glutamine methyltransferase [Deltaproteobacteria bacterium]|nr:peptide chain release factor N(5)-glutamine methyltransferase [Deltaproteobacteria bacterium]
MSDSWTLLKTLQWTVGYFEQKGIAQARVDAEVLLAHVLGMQRILLYAHHDRPLTGEERDRYRELVRRRAQGREPVQYLTGKQEFWSLSFRVEPGVLIPRADTEVLVEEALAHARALPDERQAALRIADVGTGTGCIAIALAHELPGATVLAGDVAEVPLRLAAANAEALGVEARVRVLRADGLTPLFEAGGGQPFDLIVSNPPYIPDGEHAGLMPEVRDHEPRQALTAGPEGLDVLGPLIAASAGEGVLAPGGAVLVEVSDGAQADAVVRRFEAAGFEAPRIRQDYSGLARVVVARSAG